MKNILEQILQLYKLDKTGEGESNKLVIVLRTVELTVILYGIICFIYFMAVSMYSVGYQFAGIAIVFFVLLALSYRAKVRTQIILTNVVMLAYVFSSFILFGTGTLVRNYFLALVILAYFSGYGNNVIKGIYAAFVCTLYIVLQYSIGRVEPTINLSHWNEHFLQMMNIIFPFLCVAVVCYVYSNDSQHLEGKLIEYNNLLKKQASTDPLTGLCNRRSAMDKINELIKNNPENGFCVCMCDIDFFKKVNDTYGHDVGDNVLRGVAKTMKEGFPPSCLISRWGGEEFLVIFPNMNGDDAKMILDIIRAKIKKLVFDVSADKQFTITVTYGLAEYGYNGNVEEFVKEADNKLYYGKEHGRDQVVF